MAAGDTLLPGLQLRFFLGLLQRRRWLILPLALLGLVVGTGTSLLIPRYYRSETQFHLKRIGQQGSDFGPDEDPMEAEVEAARFTITSHVHFLSSARRLGWPEFFTNDPEDPEVRAAVEAARKRVKVYLVSSRKITGHIGISYADKDAGRSAEMANTLRDLWLEERQRKVRSELKANYDQAWALLIEARQEYEQAAEALQEFNQANRIHPTTDREGRERGGTGIFDQLEEKEKTIAEQEARLAELEKARDNLAARLAETDPVLSRVTGTEEALNQLLAPYLVRRAQLVHLLEKVYSEPHPLRRSAEREVEMIDEQVARIRRELGESEVARRANPDYVKLEKELQARKDEIDAVQSSLEVYRRQRETLIEEARRFPALKRDHDRLAAAVEDAQELVTSRKQQVAAQNEQLAFFNSGLHHEVTSEAYPPPKPNDPATWVIVLIGMVIGLGVAVGFIVLIEVLRISFRSVEEAEAALPIPVLGACTYVETEAEVREAGRRRLVASLAAAVVILSLATILVLYFVDPARLPLFAQKALDHIFGAG